MQTADDTRNSVKEEPRATSGCGGVGPSSGGGGGGPNQRRGKIAEATRRRAARSPSCDGAKSELRRRGYEQQRRQRVRAGRLVHAEATSDRAATASLGLVDPGVTGAADREKGEATAADLEKGEAAATNIATVVARLAGRLGKASSSAATARRPSGDGGGGDDDDDWWRGGLSGDGAAGNGFAEVTIEMGLQEEEEEDERKCNRSKSVADQPTWTAYVAFVAILFFDQATYQNLSLITYVDIGKYRAAAALAVDRDDGGGGEYDGDGGGGGFSATMQWQMEFAGTRRRAPDLATDRDKLGSIVDLSQIRLRNERKLTAGEIGDD
ncbi:hypothetical protein Scep_023555 [Stephania cephalantha]|uniref:Uncharacterized protein n=1 Tax=Stephania cephalantha TaxID=152367 RepID=A0AAP0HXL8_9MAGN